MMEDREPLTFNRPGVAGEPTNIVVTATVQVVDANGNQVAAGSGRVVRMYEELPEDLTVIAQGLCEAALVEAEESEAEGEPVDPSTLTNEQLKALLDERQIPYAAKATKAELVEALQKS